MQKEKKQTYLFYFIIIIVLTKTSNPLNDEILSFISHKIAKHPLCFTHAAKVFQPGYADGWFL